MGIPADKRFVLVLLLSLLAVLPLSAQDSASGSYGKFKNESEFYYINIPIEKVYPHQLGYVVLYRAGNGLKRAYLPMEWFAKAAGKAQLVKIPSGNVWPSLVVYYKAGSFSHAILYVRGNVLHQSWGNIPSGADLTDEFKVEELRVP